MVCKADLAHNVRNARARNPELTQRLSSHAPRPPERPRALSLECPNSPAAVHSPDQPSLRLISGRGKEMLKTKTFVRLFSTKPVSG
jgi:hypothetical protein